MYLGTFQHELQLSMELKKVLRTLQHESFFIHFTFIFFPRQKLRLQEILEMKL